MGTYGKQAEELWTRRGAEGDAAWAERLLAARRNDFDTGKLVEVDGWWLAETELLLCVLAHRARVDRTRRPGPLPC